MDGGFFAELRRRVDARWQEILGHPFLEELSSGTLPRRKFFYYLSQDDYYLEDMLAAVGVLVAQAKTKDLRRFAVRLLHETVQGEMAMHEALEKAGDYTPCPPSSVTLEYGDFLVRTAFLGSPLEILASLAPCFVSYREIGCRYVQKLSQNTPELYREFFATYAGEAYGKLVEEFLSFLEREALQASLPERERAYTLFARATEYEWHFWEESYRFLPS